MEITSYLESFFNHPLIQTIIEICLGGIWILSILAKTSIGRKSLNKLRDLHKEKNEALEKAKKDIDDANKSIEELAKNKDAIIVAQKEEFNAKYQLLANKMNLQIDVILEALSHINNDHIKNIIEKFKESQKVEKPIEFSEIVKKADLYDELIKRVEALEDERKETINCEAKEE